MCYLFRKITTLLALSLCISCDTTKEPTPDSSNDSHSLQKDAEELVNYFKKNLSLNIDNLLSNNKELKIILKYNAVGRTYILKQDHNKVWHFWNEEFAKNQPTPESTDHFLPQSPSSYLILTKNNQGLYETFTGKATDTYTKNNSTHTKDEHHHTITYENFEDYMKSISPSWKEFFPDGYRKQLDNKGSFIVE